MFDLSKYLFLLLRIYFFQCTKQNSITRSNLLPCSRSLWRHDSTRVIWVVGEMYLLAKVRFRESQVLIVREDRLWLSSTYRPRLLWTISGTHLIYVVLRADTSLQRLKKDTEIDTITHRHNDKMASIRGRHTYLRRVLWFDRKFTEMFTPQG